MVSCYVLMCNTAWEKRESVSFCTKMSVTVLFAAGGFVGYSFLHLELIASLSLIVTTHPVLSFRLLDSVSKVSQNWWIVSKY